MTGPAGSVGVPLMVSTRVGYHHGALPPVCLEVCFWQILLQKSAVGRAQSGETKMSKPLLAVRPKGTAARRTHQHTRRLRNARRGLSGGLATNFPRRRRF